MVRVLTAALALTRGAAAAPTSEMELVIHKKDDEIIESVCVAELAVRLPLLLGLLATC